MMKKRLSFIISIYWSQESSRLLNDTGKKNIVLAS